MRVAVQSLSSSGVAKLVHFTARPQRVVRSAFSAGFNGSFDILEQMMSFQVA